MAAALSNLNLPTHQIAGLAPKLAQAVGVENSNGTNALRNPTSTTAAAASGTAGAGALAAAPSTGNSDNKNNTGFSGTETSTSVAITGGDSTNNITNNGSDQHVSAALVAAATALKNAKDILSLAATNPGTPAGLGTFGPAGLGGAGGSATAGAVDTAPSLALQLLQRLGRLQHPAKPGPDESIPSEYRMGMTQAATTENDGSYSQSEQYNNEGTDDSTRKNIKNKKNPQKKHGGNGTANKTVAGNGVLDDRADGLVPPSVSQAKKSGTVVERGSSDSSDVGPTTMRCVVMKEDEKNSNSDKNSDKRVTDDDGQNINGTGISQGSTHARGTSGGLLPTATTLACRARGMPMDHNFTVST